MIRRLPSQQRNALIRRERDRAAFKRLLVLLFCGLGLASGFVYAGRQHFAALRYGYETENLRRVRDQLSEKQRRFLLQREEAASPMRLERAAKQLGMQALQPAQVDPLRQAVKGSNASSVLTVNPIQTRQDLSGRGARIKPRSTARTQTNRAPNKPI